MYATRKHNLKCALLAIKNSDHKATKFLTMPLVKVKWLVQIAITHMVQQAQNYLRKTQ
jgi:hypothetical protein